MDEEWDRQGFSSPVSRCEEFRSYSKADGKLLGLKVNWFNVHLRRLLSLCERISGNGGVGRSMRAASASAATAEKPNGSIRGSAKDS